MTTMTKPQTIEWRSHGRVNCKGDVLTIRQPDGTVRVTCSRCSLDYTIRQGRRDD